MNHIILLTFDVEDWFQVENFKQYIPFSSWPSYELRAEKNTHHILDLLDSVKLNYSTNAINPINSSNSTNPISPKNSTSVLSPHDSNFLPQSSDLKPQSPIRATFFVLGWIAKRLPHLVREIQARGHEVASHGYDHKLCKEQSGDELKIDLSQSKRLLEDITGNPIYGYRAPSFSINQDILRIIEDSGYFYDSSFNSFGLNKRYGKVNCAGNGRNGISFQISGAFYELPISNIRIGKYVFPWGGGGYFRLIPLQLFKLGVQSILEEHGAYLFYLHPWEIDPDQPKVTGAQLFNRFRHYTNLNKALPKLSFFIESFKDCYFQTCYQYIAPRKTIPLQDIP